MIVVLLVVVFFGKKVMIFILMVCFVCQVGMISRLVCCLFGCLMVRICCVGVLMVVLVKLLCRVLISWG